MKSFKLDDIEKKGQPYSVPEGYFEDLPMKIQSKIQEERREPWIRWSRLKAPVMGAASLAIILMVIFIERDRTPEEMIANISTEELLAYVDFTLLEDAEIFAAFQEEVIEVDFTDANDFESLELEDESLDDLLLEYDISNEYL